MLKIFQNCDFLGSVCKTVRRNRTGVCLSVCLSVCVSSNVGIMAKRLDGSICLLVRTTEVGLGPGHIVLDGDPAPQKGAQQPPLLGPCLLWPNDWMDQDVTWYGGIGIGPGDIVLCVRWGPSSPPPKKRSQQPFTFRHMSIVAKLLHVSGYHLVRRYTDVY